LQICGAGSVLLLFMFLLVSTDNAVLWRLVSRSVVLDADGVKPFRIELDG
jgi:hypothetical protein